LDTRTWRVQVFPPSVVERTMMVGGLPGGPGKAVAMTKQVVGLGQDSRSGLRGPMAGLPAQAAASIPVFALQVAPLLWVTRTARLCPDPLFPRRAAVA
jgi:hypothetical protein